MKPDIVINLGKENCIVLDAKWKNLNGHNPSPEDLRQMYTYLKYFKALKVALVYPGEANLIQGGKYFNEDGNIGVTECSLIFLSVEKEINNWQKKISIQILDWTSC